MVHHRIPKPRQTVAHRLLKRSGLHVEEPLFSSPSVALQIPAVDVDGQSIAHPGMLRWNHAFDDGLARKHATSVDR